MARYTVRGSKRYPDACCRVGISVGSDAHEGARLEALLAWVGREYEHTHIYVGDTLYRHNRQFLCGESEAEAHAASRRAGDAWFTRNRGALDALAIPSTVSRWDDWLADPRYPRVRAALQALHDESSVLKDACRRDAAQFLVRLATRGAAPSDAALAGEKSLAFVLEENAVFALVSHDYPGTDVYPGAELRSTRLLGDMPLPPELRALAGRRYMRVAYRSLPGRPTPGAVRGERHRDG
jgi:tRNA-dependent cyclodipeptide synthase